MPGAYEHLYEPPKLIVPRLDGIPGTEQALFSRALTSHWAEVFNVKHAALRALELIPLDTDTHPDDETYTYEVYDSYGAAVLVRDGTEHIPPSDVAGVEHMGRMWSYATKYGWALDDVLAAARAGKPLQNLKQQAARRTINQTIDQILAFGKAELRTLGFFTQPNVPLLLLPNGASGSRHWDKKTGEEVLKDLNLIANYAPRASLEIEHADTLVLPPAALTYIRNTRLTPDNNTTIAEFFQGNNGHIQHLEPWHKANTAGVGGVCRGVAYRKSPDILRAIVPKPYDQRPPQQTGWRIENHVRCKIGGVKVLFPLSMLYFDGFLDPALSNPDPM